MSRTLTRPMFRKGGMAQRKKYMGGGIKTIRPKYMGGGLTGIMSGIVPDAGLTPRTGFQDGTELDKLIAAQELTDPSTIIYDKDYIQKLLDQKTRKLYEPGLPGYGQQIATPDTPTQRGIKEYLETNPEGAYELFKTGKLPGFGDTDYGALQAAQAKKAKEAGIDLNLGETKIDTSDAINTNDSLNIEGGEKDIKDEETALMKAYKEYAPIFEKELGVSSDDTKKALYLQLAKVGLGVAGAPGGDLLGTIAREGQKGIEGAEEILSEKRKGDKDIKLLALQKTFDDMKEPEQIKYIKAIQKEYGLDSFEEAYELITKPKKSSAEMRADDEFYRKTGEQMGVSADGFKREMKKLEGTKFEDLIGVLSRNDAALPKDPEDRTNYEYYVQPKDGKPVRFVDGKLYKPGEPEFIMPIPTTET